MNTSSCNTIPIKDCCCTKNIRKSLIAIQSTVAEMNIPGFSVNILITTTTGLQYPIFISASTANPVIIGEDTITYDKTSISLCAIAKIEILSSQFLNNGFANKLLLKLKCLTNICPELAMTVENSNYNYSTKGCKGSFSPWRLPSERDLTDCCCTPGMQDYLNENKDNLNSVSYEGSLKYIEPIYYLTDIVTTTVVKDFKILVNTVPALNNVTLNIVNATIVNSIFTVSISAINGFTTIPSALLDITDTTDLAETPINVVPTTIVTSAFRVTPIDAIITNIAPSSIPFVSSIATVPTTIKNFPNYTTAVGVPTGATTALSIPTKPVTIPNLTAATGGLFIFYGGVTIPLIDALGNNVTIGATTNVNLLTLPTNLLGGLTATPEVGPPDVVSSLGAPVTINVLSNVIPTALPAITSVVTGVSTIPNTFFDRSNSSIMNVVSGSLSSVPIINSITTIPHNSELVGSFTSTTISNVSDVVSQNVVQSVTLTNTSVEVVSSVTSNPQFITAVESASVSSIDVIAPVFEPITGTIEGIGGGLVIISLPNGDITILSICAIQSVETN